MPSKHNESRRHKIEKVCYKVTNWHDYNNGLRKRGDFTICFFTEETIAEWHPAKTGVYGRPQVYSDIAIETASLIRQVFHLPLRQTEGFMNSLARVMKVDSTIPDFSSITLLRQILTKAMELGSLWIVDSTGLKVYGKDEWHHEKHDVPAWRTWLKLTHPFIPSWMMVPIKVSRFLKQF
jgi:hypothetical protein